MGAIVIPLKVPPNYRILLQIWWVEQIDPTSGARAFQRELHKLEPVVDQHLLNEATLLHILP